MLRRALLCLLSPLPQHRPPSAFLRQGLLHSVLLPAFAELDGEGKSPLHHVAIGAALASAARRGAAHLQLSNVLLVSGCQVDTQDAHGCTPLHFAAGECGAEWTGSGRGGLLDSEGGTASLGLVTH